MILTGENRSTGRERERERERDLSHCHVAHETSHWTGLRLNTCLYGDNPAASEIRCGWLYFNYKLSLSYEGVPCADTCVSCHVLATVNLIAVVHILRVTCSNCRSCRYTVRLAA